MTATQKDEIKKNLQAFEHNFGPARIEDAKHWGGFFVYYPPESNEYIQYCKNIDYLNGWLYGIVQGRVRGEFNKMDRYGSSLVNASQSAKV